MLLHCQCKRCSLHVKKLTWQKESKVSDLLSEYLTVTFRAAQCECCYFTGVRIQFTLAVLSQEYFSSVSKYFQVARSNFREGKFTKAKWQAGFLYVSISLEKENVIKHSILHKINLMLSILHFMSKLFMLLLLKCMLQGHISSSYNGILELVTKKKVVTCRQTRQKMEMMHTDLCCKGRGVVFDWFWVCLWEQRKLSACCRPAKKSFTCKTKQKSKMVVVIAKLHQKPPFSSKGSLCPGMLLAPC